ncbi:hypothetical protein JL193_04490 [Polaribacter batillariae]|uniref:Thioredoxin domain-containing protein n=1 Tax=Polaribacter batillariae TaxID=2808900 RepID=A0ABX7SZW9_9FLAO|nr:hypothetical protein [Polaribacter batillariae]QTD38551.1 hypothetical protein JL193_04490 [Polaribacter batillariae]
MKQIYILKYFVLITFVFCIISCKKGSNNEIKPLRSVIEKTIGKKLVLPDNIKIYAPFSNYIADSSNIWNSEYRIYSRIDASCGTCIGNIKMWSKLIPEFQKYKVPIILIFHSDDRFELIKYFCESGQIEEFSFPFFFDSENKYAEMNEFMKINKNFETVLTDTNNTILLTGNPTTSTDIMNLYIKEVSK